MTSEALEALKLIAKRADVDTGNLLMRWFEDWVMYFTANVETSEEAQKHPDLVEMHKDKGSQQVGRMLYKQRMFKEDKFPMGTQMTVLVLRPKRNT